MTDLFWLTEAPDRQDQGMNTGLSAVTDAQSPIRFFMMAERGGSVIARARQRCSAACLRPNGCWRIAGFGIP